MTAANDHRLRVATWNIHRCVGLDRRHDPDRVLSMIEAMDADVVALQEVPTRTRHRALRQLLEGHAGYHALIEDTLPDSDSGFGNALLCRLPVLDASRVDLGVNGREPRCAIDARVQSAPSGALRILATHLGLSAEERRQQLERLRGLLQGEAALVLGDFNAWRGWPQAWPEGWQPQRHARAPRTFPAIAPLLRLDHILASPHLRIRGLRTWRESGMRLASDHLPVVAEIALR